MADLEAGRELDALVAEKVMGWTIHERYVMGPLAHGGGMMKLYSGIGIPDAKGQIWAVDSFQPSIDIAAAWEVVEKLRPIYHCYLCAVRGNVGWTMQFANNAPPHAEALAETAPLAICRAALLAVEAHDG